MKIHAETFYDLDDCERQLLAKYRQIRAFNASEWLENKTAVLKRYMDRFGLKAAVVGMSGGIDSAVVSAICARAGVATYGVSLPDHSENGVRNQVEGYHRAALVAEKFHFRLLAMDISTAATVIQDDVDWSFEHTASPWCAGQLRPYTRTPYLYYVATVLKELNRPAVVVGTTNRDEGSYLGYVGKASDGMVDLQLISDLHKSEVYAVAKLLDMPTPLMEATPTGDMFDGRADVEIFGTSYDAVELSMYRAPEDRGWVKNLQALHRLNRHKYLSQSPAIHLDIIESGVALRRGDGWPIQFGSRYWHELSTRLSDNGLSALEFLDLMDTYKKGSWARYRTIDGKLHINVGLASEWFIKRAPSFFRNYTLTQFENSTHQVWENLEWWL